MIDIREHGGNYGSGSGGASSKINIFCQPNEPKIKEGIWIQSPNIEKVREVTVDDKVFTGGQWSTTPNNIQLPLASGKSFNGSKLYRYVKIGNAIYSSGLGYSEGCICKYDISNNIWTPGPPITNLTLAPYGAFVAIGTKIYRISGGNGVEYKEVIIYDTTNNTWKLGAQMPYERECFYYTEYEGKIYCIGGWGNHYGHLTNNVVYDTEKDTWTEIAQIPHSFWNGACVGYKNKIYIFGGGSLDENPTNLSMVYDIATNKWSNGVPLPIKARFLNSSVLIGNKVICFSESGTCTYDLDNGTWEVGQKAPESIGGCCLVDKEIICFSEDGMHVYVYSLISKQYKEGNIVINRKNDNIGTYVTQLANISTKINGSFTRFATAFDDAWIFKDNDLKPYPTYYGDGEKWIKFKG